MASDVKVWRAIHIQCRTLRNTPPADPCGPPRGPALLVFLSILDLQQKHGAALEVIQGPAGALFTLPADRARLEVRGGLGWVCFKGLTRKDNSPAFSPSATFHSTALLHKCSSQWVLL